jgi:hypothetical protein
MYIAERKGSTVGLAVVHAAAEATLHFHLEVSIMFAIAAQAVIALQIAVTVQAAIALKMEVMMNAIVSMGFVSSQHWGPLKRLIVATSVSVSVSDF